MMHRLTNMVGIGDLLEFESFFTDEERDSIRHITWCGEAHRIGIPLFRSTPRYRHVKHRVLKNQSEITDQDIHNTTSKFFTLCNFRQYNGSTFVQQNLSCCRYDLPRPFYVCQPSTPFNTDSHRVVRDMRADDWKYLLQRLDDEEVTLVVLNSQAGTAPAHRRILDLGGKTTFPESVEILKSGDGYWGIDSCLAILAAKVFPAERLLIRTQNPYLVENARLAYAPHQDFPFLVPTLGHPPYPKPKPWELDNSMVLLQLKVSALIGSRCHLPGEVIELDPERAKSYLERGLAEVFVPPIVEHAVKPMTRERKVKRT